MAFKNIFSSAYAIVENVTYNGSRKFLTFDLVLYRDSSKSFETGRMQYQVEGNLTTYDIDSVITAVPSGLEKEALPADFDFDAFDDFKPYLIGNNPTSDEFTAAGCGELKTGFQYVCEIPPSKDDDGKWPSRITEEYEQIKNPDYDTDNANYNLASGEVRTTTDALTGEEVSVVGAADGTTVNPAWTPEFIDGDDQIVVQLEIKYDWGALHKSTAYAFLDKAGEYWTVTGDTGSVNVSQIDKPFLTTDWDTWFSSTAMDKLNKNIQERIYSWLKTKSEYSAAVNI
jgi:hypothetical protein